MVHVITSEELPRLFACLEPYRRLVLGVSGGADSLCLMHLVAEWRAGAAASEGPDVLVVTIDHQLRAASASEAVMVAERAAVLGFMHRTLVWDGPKPESGLQAEAREMRYRLLQEAAQGDGMAAVVVAHTQDDQAETVVMRLKRGTGIDGLSGMAVVRHLTRHVDLVRPLLGVSRAEIEAALSARGMSWISDPSNENRAFERIRLRQARPALDEIGLSPDMLALTAKRVGRAERALEQMTGEILERDVPLHEGAFASMDLARFMACPDDIQVRICERLVSAYGGGGEPALLSQVEALVEEIAKGEPCRMSLGGAIVSASPRALRVYREPGRLGSAPVSLPAGGGVIWDRRFWVSMGDGTVSDGPLTVAPLLASGTLSVDATLAEAGLSVPQFAKGWPRQAIMGLPAIRTGSRLIAVPHFDQHQETDSGFRVKFLGLEGESSEHKGSGSSNRRGFTHG